MAFTFSLRNVLKFFFTVLVDIKTMTLAALLCALAGTAQLNGSVQITGRVVNEASNPLEAVSITVKGTRQGTTTDSTGQFSLIVNQRFPFTLLFSSVGYAPQELEIKNARSTLSVQLTTQTFIANEVVVTASRSEESRLKSPVAIEKLSIRTLKETPAPSFYDALANVKGVQLTTSSLTFKVPNTRGFNNPNNFRFMQVVDGVDMQAATLGVPLGNTIGPTELDIQSVEITPGAASALYGMNAINGMANLLTKSAFTHRGLSFYQKIGVNHVDNRDRNASLLTETAVRWADVINDKWAYKINLSYLRGTDWVSSNPTDQNAAANSRFAELNGVTNNPGYDAWNKYGDENNNNVSVQVRYNNRNETFNVRRTGYWEKDLAQPQVENLKFDAAVYYKINRQLELSYAYRIGEMDGIFQRGNKIQLDGVTVQNHKLELKGNNFFVRTYASIENTGNSYNLKPLADNLDLTHLSNAAWASRFGSTLQSEINAGTTLAEAMRRARTQADAGRVLPGTDAFNQLKQTIIGINNWDHANLLPAVPGAPATGGAWLTQRSRIYHLDAQWDLSDKVKWFNLLTGVDWRTYEVIPDGNNFVDFSKPLELRTTPGGRNVYYHKYGVFAQATRQFFKEKLKVTASLRLDQNLEFNPQFNPRIAAIWSITPRQTLRASYQNGFRFPALFEALSYVNNGNVRRVGGLAFINEGLGYLDNSYTLASVTAFNNAVNRDVANGTNRNQAALNNRAILQITNLSPTRPEQVNSFEVGYRSIWLNNRLTIDIDAYYNIYNGFLGQVEVAVPGSGRVGSDESVLDMLSANRVRQQRYRVFTNAKNEYRSYGAAIGVTYNFYKTYTISGNANYNKLQENKEADVFLTGFNTPDWVVNLSFGNREVIKNTGFNIVWRWQNAFNWESPLAVGRVPANQQIDAQVNHRLPKLKTTVKLGASNLLNKRYIQYAAGPTIGGLYYLAITIDGLLK
ncbi:MAG: TonB-dependent receptor [Chitinophagaceae bacterium]|nr:TonB-dependent receptor [Chitinophagaceae bacterium]